MPLRSSQLDRLFFLSIFLKNISKAQNLSPFYFYAWQWVSNNHRFYSKSVFLPRTLRTLLRYNWQVESAYIFRCLMWCLIPIYIVKWLGNKCVSWAPLPFITVGRTEVWAIFPLHSWVPSIGFLSTTKSPPFQCIAWSAAPLLWHSRSFVVGKHCLLVSHSSPSYPICTSQVDSLTTAKPALTSVNSCSLPPSFLLKLHAYSEASPDENMLFVEMLFQLRVPKN